MLKNNPCRYCVASYYDAVTKRHMPHFTIECKVCEYRKSHEQYLLSQRKFARGDPIKSFDELIENDWVIWHGKTISTKVVLNWQASMILRQIENKTLYKAIGKENE